MRLQADETTVMAEHLSLPGAIRSAQRNGPDPERIRPGTETQSTQIVSRSMRRGSSTPLGMHTVCPFASPTCPYLKPLRAMAQSPILVTKPPAGRTVDASGAAGNFASRFCRGLGTPRPECPGERNGPGKSRAAGDTACTGVGAEPLCIPCGGLSRFPMGHHSRTGDPRAAGHRLHGESAGRPRTLAARDRPPADRIVREDRARRRMSPSSRSRAVVENQAPDRLCRCTRPGG